MFFFFLSEILYQYRSNPFVKGFHFEFLHKLFSTCDQRIVQQHHTVIIAAKQRVHSLHVTTLRTG